MALPIIPPQEGFNFSVQFDLEDLLFHISLRNGLRRLKYAVRKS